MTIASAAIRTSIKELLQGTIGTTRTVGSTLYGYGIFIGQPTMAQQALTIQSGTKRSRFDIRLSSMIPHPSTPLSIKSSYRNIVVGVEIDINTTLNSTAMETARNTQREVIESDADVAIQALCYPGNLTTTSASVATGIIGGMLFGPGGKGTPAWQVTSEDWTTHILRSVIKASAIIQVTQATS